MWFNEFINQPVSEEKFTSHKEREKEREREHENISSLSIWFVSKVFNVTGFPINIFSIISAACIVRLQLNLSWQQVGWRGKIDIKYKKEKEKKKQLEAVAGFIYSTWTNCNYSGVLETHRETDLSGIKKETAHRI